MESSLESIVKASYAASGEPASLLVGLSGGADSVCLTCLLKELQQELGYRLVCAHVNHHLRDHAALDEAFVRQFCQRLGLELVARDITVPRRGNLEAAAREARYRAFEEVMEEEGIAALALGHHMDDQAETLLMRLMRGAGPTGLAAMREHSGRIWRPLLQVRRRQIEGYLRDRGLTWREDESNEDERYTRNFIRRRLIPLMEERSPAAVSAMASASLLLGDEESYWDDFCTQWLSKNASLHPSCLFINLLEFDTLHTAARRRVLRAFCQRADLAPGREQLERLMALSLQGKSGDTENLQGGGKAFRSVTRLHLIRPLNLPLPLGTLIPVKRDKAGGRRVESFDARLLEGAELRRRKPGDIIQPLGMRGRQSLSDYMINRRMDRPLRDQWPLLARGREILWVVGFGMAQTAALSAETEKSVRLLYQGRLPDETEEEWKAILKEDGDDAE